MGRYWSVRRAGSNGPSAASGAVVLVPVVSGLHLGQDEAETPIFAQWPIVAEPSLTVSWDLQYFDIDSWQSQTTGVVDGSALELTTDFAPVAGAAIQYRIVMSADGYADVISDTLVSL